MIFINFVILNVFKNKKDIDKLLNDEFLIDDKYDKFKITEYVFEKIQMGLSQHHSFSKLVTTWEDYLLGPIIFAGYSNEKNISNYNLKLKEKIIRRLADIFDSDKIIRSIVKKEIEIPMEVNEE